MPTSVRPCVSTIGIAVSSSSRAAPRIDRVWAVACTSVCERVAREKSAKRSRSTTVRHTRWPARRRRATRSTSATRVASMSSRDLGPPAEGPLRPDRAPAPTGHHGSRVAVVRERVQVPARRPSEHPHEGCLVERRHLRHRPEPAPVELGGRHAADSPEPLHRQGMEERQLALRRDDQQAVRLRHCARDLGQELRPRHPDRDREPDLLEDVSPQSLRDLGGRPSEALEPANVEERLVDREALDERRRRLEHLEHRLARVGVRGHSRCHDDRVRAEPSGPPPAHGRADPVRLGLVARREDDPAPRRSPGGLAGAGRRAVRPTRRRSRRPRAGSSARP